MATSLVTTLQAVLSAVQSNPLDLSTPRDALTWALTDALAQGTGLDQADLIWHDRRTLVGANEELDLSGGGAVLLKDPWGDTITFVKVRALLIKNRNTGAGEVLTVGGAAATQFADWVGAVTDKVIIDPDGLLLLWNPKDGYLVGAGASDMLRIDAGAETIEYDIVIIGVSA